MRARRLEDDEEFLNLRFHLRGVLRVICGRVAPYADIDFVPASHVKGRDRCLPVPGARAPWVLDHSTPLNIANT